MIVNIVNNIVTSIQSAKTVFLNFSVNNLAKDIFTNHYDRVIADGGTIENNSEAINFVNDLVRTYSITSESDFKSKIPIVYNTDLLGYKKGTGSGITAGQACEKLYSINEDADITQSTAANKPLILEHRSENYYFAARTDSADVINGSNDSFTFEQGTDTVVVKAKLLYNSNVSTTSYDSIFQYGGNFRVLARNAGATIRPQLRLSGAAFTAALYTPSTTEPHWLRITIDDTNVEYAWSADDVTYTVLDTVALPTTGATTGQIAIGAGSLNAANACKIFKVDVENQTTGERLTFDPNEFNRAITQDRIFGSNCDYRIAKGSNTTGLKSILVDSTIVVGDGIGYKLNNSSFVLQQPYTGYLALEQSGNGSMLGLQANSDLRFDGTDIILDNGAELTLANTQETKKLITFAVSAANSELYVDNELSSEGDSGSNDGTYIDVFANGATYGSMVLYFLIIRND